MKKLQESETNDDKKRRDTIWQLEYVIIYDTCTAQLMCSMLVFQNKHFEVSHIVSSVFTGREVILKRIATIVIP